MTDIIIPKEVLEAAAQAIFDASPFREAEAPFREQSAQYQALTRAYARAACLAMLKNWPGMHEVDHRVTDKNEVVSFSVVLPIILPLPKKEPEA